jgi:hypothetical protein
MTIQSDTTVLRGVRKTPRVLTVLWRTGPMVDATRAMRAPLTRSVMDGIVTVKR